MEVLGLVMLLKLRDCVGEDDLEKEHVDMGLA